MFTGLVAAVGELTEVTALDGGARRLVLREGRPGGGLLEETKTGDSVSVSGVCLTVLTRDRDARTAAFEAAAETLARTTLGSLQVRSPVNLELPLRAGDRLGGHFVQGHVDAVGEVAAAGGTDADYRVRVLHPESRWIVQKGSVALDGVSLTVAREDARAGWFEVMLIPHTRSHTTLGQLRSGDPVNIEYDVLAKYVAQAVGGFPGVSR